jgi:hypothetical protein
MRRLRCFTGLGRLEGICLTLTLKLSLLGCRLTRGTVFSCTLLCVYVCVCVCCGTVLSRTLLCVRMCVRMCMRV